MSFLALLALIHSLGSPDYAAREKATAALTALNVPGPVLFWASSHPDPEIAARSKALHRDWCWETAQTLRPVDYPFTPWIDSMPLAALYREEIDAYLELVSAGADQPPGWPRYRQATKLYVFDLLLAGKTEADIQLLFSQAVAKEKQWILRNRASFAFPAELLQAAEGK